MIVLFEFELCFSLFNFFDLCLGSLGSSFSFSSEISFLFNDSFSFEYVNGSKIYINETNIARKFDRENYKIEHNLYKPWLNIEDEHFLVWMRTSPFANFTKLYGRIPKDIEPNKNIIINITHGKYYNETEYEDSRINNLNQVKNLEFFKEIDFNKIKRQEMKSPFIPEVVKFDYIKELNNTSKPFVDFIEDEKVENIKETILNKRQNKLLFNYENENINESNFNYHKNLLKWFEKF